MVNAREIECERNGKRGREGGEDSGEGCTLQQQWSISGLHFVLGGSLGGPLPCSLSLSLSFPAYHHLYSMHTLIRSVRAYTHERAPSAVLPLASPLTLSYYSLFFPPVSFFAPSVCFYVWTSKVRRKGCCALRVRNSRDIDKNKVHPHPHPRRASPIVGN